MEDRIRRICQKEGLPARTVQPLLGGQVNQAFLVDETYVVRIGAREDALARLERETRLLQSLAGEIPVPSVVAFGQQDGLVYQIQERVRGQKLYSAWNGFSPAEQDRIVGELAVYLRILHAKSQAVRSEPGDIHSYAQNTSDPTWPGFLSARFHHSLAELRDLGIPLPPDLLILAVEYFEAHHAALQETAPPTLVHGDLWLGNLLVHAGRITALLDFEYALQAPPDYELLKLEDFCLYPNDYTDEGGEFFCTADFAGFFPLLRRHYAGLFQGNHLRERLDLYHLESALSDYLAWRKDNRSTIPLSSPAALGFLRARIANFTFAHGARLC